MIELTAEMAAAIDGGQPGTVPVVVATAGADGRTDIALKASTMVFDGEHLAFWERAAGRTLANLEENPHISLLYFNRERRLIWRFFGQAELLRDGAVRDQIMARTIQGELDRDPERHGVGVLIRIDSVNAGNSVIMQRDA